MSWLIFAVWVWLGVLGLVVASVALEVWADRATKGAAMSDHLEPIPEHSLRVTRGPARAYVDCSGDEPPQVVHASMRAAERAALRHYVEHAPDGDDRDRAARLLTP